MLTKHKMVTKHRNLDLLRVLPATTVGNGWLSTKTRTSQLEIFEFSHLLFSFCLKKGVSSVSHAPHPFLTHLIGLFQSLKHPLSSITPLSASKRCVDSVFATFSYF